MGIFMSIQHPHSVGKVRKILLFEAVFHDSVSDCTKLTLADKGYPHSYEELPSGHNWATWEQGLEPGLKHLFGLPD